MIRHSLGEQNKHRLEFCRFLVQIRLNLTTIKFYFLATDVFLVMCDPSKNGL